MNKIRHNRFFHFWMPHQPTHGYGRNIEEIWVNQSGQITFVSSNNGQTLVEKVTLANSHPMLTYAYIQTRNDPRSPYKALLEANSCVWTGDFWWDLETGLVAAYLLGDASIAHFDQPISTDLEDSNVMDAEIIHVKPKIKKRFRQLAVGLRRWWRNTSQKPRHWVQQVGSRLKNAID